ncbi:MAG: methylmalonyl Co-A mutase-associated GTPase MeaB, partial [Proteobacteria bacterium]|nr:methylmalonyl Co-A mutase-associated GTPase MeaB [Pseudomonadota bacterium]
MTGAAPDTVTPENGLASQVLAGGRRALARAITLIESERADHRDEAETLLRDLL